MPHPVFQQRFHGIYRYSQRIRDLLIFHFMKKHASNNFPCLFRHSLYFSLHLLNQRVVPLHHLLLNHFFPLYGLAYAQFTAELVLSIAAVIILVKLFRKLELEKAERDAQKAQKA